MCRDCKHRTHANQIRKHHEFEETSQCQICRNAPVNIRCYFCIGTPEDKGVSFCKPCYDHEHPEDFEHCHTESEPPTPEQRTPNMMESSAAL